MKFAQRVKEGVVILDLSGKLMGGPDADNFKRIISDLIEKGSTRVVSNLREVKRINSTGVGILITGYTTLRRNGGDMKLLHVSEKIRSILYVTKLNLIFECYDNEDEAVESFELE